eukprot:scaffold29564_cov226-Skeletonema_marinoi.AAC.2
MKDIITVVDAAFCIAFAKYIDTGDFAKHNTRPGVGIGVPLHYDHKFREEAALWAIVLNSR